MPEIEKTGFGEFARRAVTVTLCAVVVIIFARLLIIDELIRLKDCEKERVPAPEAAPAVYEEAHEDEKKPQEIKWQDASSHEGGYVRVKGVIASSKNTGKVCFLNFDKDYKNTMTLVIFSSNFKRFPANPEKHYLGRQVTVEGRVKMYKGKPEIILGSAEQIKAE
jgi:DNA/RNA endonuclease YhcR with UshA esterase domain